jgi:hypothetical protein
MAYILLSYYFFFIISDKEVTDTDTDTDTNAAMEKADRALEVKRIMRDIMRLSKEELRREISSRQDSMEELQEEPPKTIENMRLSLLAVKCTNGCDLCIDCIVFYMYEMYCVLLTALCIVDCIVYCVLFCVIKLANIMCQVYNAVP